jgi:hypothetical protein
MYRITRAGECDIQRGITGGNGAWRGVLNHFIQREIFKKTASVDFVISCSVCI